MQHIFLRRPSLLAPGPQRLALPVAWACQRRPLPGAHARQTGQRLAAGHRAVAALCAAAAVGARRSGRCGCRAAEEPVLGPRWKVRGLKLDPEATARLLLPALLAGVLGALAFCPCSLLLGTVLADPAKAVLKEDVSQFTQNAFAAAAVVFGLLLTDTLGFMFDRQERLFISIFKEAAEAQALMEQLSLLAADRDEVDDTAVCSILNEVETHLQTDLRRLSGAVLPPERGLGADPLERILFATSVGVPSSVCDTARALRQARAERLAAITRRFPLEHFVILAINGALVLSFFLLLGAGVATFEPEGQAAMPGHLLTVLAPLFGLLVTALSLSATVLRELGNPDTGLFGVRRTLQEVLQGLEVEIASRRRALAGRAQHAWQP